MISDVTNMLLEAKKALEWEIHWRKEMGAFGRELEKVSKLEVILNNLNRLITDIREE